MIKEREKFIVASVARNMPRSRREKHLVSCRCCGDKGQYVDSSRMSIKGRIILVTLNRAIAVENIYTKLVYVLQ